MKKFLKVVLPTTVIGLSIIAVSIQSSEVSNAAQFKIMGDAEFAAIQKDFEMTTEDVIFGTAHFKNTENGAFG